MRYNIKARLAVLGLKSRDLIEILRKNGFSRLSPQQFSSAINGSSVRPSDDKICAAADRELEKLERERGIKRDARENKEIAERAV